MLNPQEGACVFDHFRKDGKAGCAYLVINSSWTEKTAVELPGEVALEPGSCAFFLV